MGPNTSKVTRRHYRKPKVQYLRFGGTKPTAAPRLCSLTSRQTGIPWWAVPKDSESLSRTNSDRIPGSESSRIQLGLVHFPKRRKTYGFQSDPVGSADPTITHRVRDPFGMTSGRHPGFRNGFGKHSGSRCSSESHRNGIGPPARVRVPFGMTSGRHPGFRNGFGKHSRSRGSFVSLGSLRHDFGASPIAREPLGTLLDRRQRPSECYRKHFVTTPMDVGCRNLSGDKWL